MSDRQNFAFDDWMRLARNDPAAFEERRRQAIDEMIASAPPAVRQRLRGLQWRIDAERDRCQNPTMAFLRLYGMMWDSVYGERGLLSALNTLVDNESQRPAADQGERERAEVIPFDAGRRLS